jgi:hypothetical protein
MGVSDPIVRGEREPAWVSDSRPLEGWHEGLRLAATLIGLGLMLIGFYFAIGLFGDIYSGLKEPERLTPFIESWEKVIGGKGLDITVAGQTYPASRVSAILVLGGGCWALVYVAIGFMSAGARIVSWTATDRQAIRRIILQTFGKTGQDDARSP